jgi:hypothetical protein
MIENFLGRKKEDNLLARSWVVCLRQCQAHSLTRSRCHTRKESLIRLCILVDKEKSRVQPPGPNKYRRPMEDRELASVVLLLHRMLRDRVWRTRNCQSHSSTWTW